jgi:mannose-1-phosphate guanylyltransferase
MADGAPELFFGFIPTDERFVPTPPVDMVPPSPESIPPFGGTVEGEPEEDTQAVGTLPGEQLEPEDELQTGLSLWAIVLAGGIGSRFWPLSTPEQPKQLLALVGERPLISETVARLAPTVPSDRVLVLTSADIADALRAAIPEVPDANMLVEPRPLGTAAAVAWGAQEIERRAGRRTVFVALHADLAVGFPGELRRLLAQAGRLAAADSAIVSLGAEPTRAESGFGYIVPGLGIEGDASADRLSPRRVERFVEKPGPVLAQELIDAGAFWHTGIVVSQAGTMLDALAEHTIELQHGLAALAAGKLDRFAGLIQSVSLERGLLERSTDVVVLPGEFGFDDVGTWASLRRVRELDDTGNGIWGQAHVVDSSSCVVHADSSTVVLYGVSGMLIVARPGLTFVTTLDRATELNPLLDQLPDSLVGRAKRPDA